MTFHIHNRKGQLDRSICGQCGQAYIECTECDMYACLCVREKPMKLKYRLELFRGEKHVSNLYATSWEQASETIEEVEADGYTVKVVGINGGVVPS